MRRSSLVLVSCVVATVVADPSLAQPFWLFGRPFGGEGKHGGQARRTRHGGVTPRAQADIPLPAPRPHFASDEPPASSAASARDQGSGPTTPLEPPRTAPVVPPPSGPSSADTTQGGPTEAPLPPAKPADLAASPAPPAPVVLPSPAPLPAASSPAPTVSGADCVGRLRTKKVEAETISVGVQPDPRCTVANPVALRSLVLPDGSTVNFPDRPTLACATADTFGTYVRDLLAPLAKGSFGTALAGVWTGPGLECRPRDNIFGAKLSSHGQGLAVDIAQLRLADGRVLAVGMPKDGPDSAFAVAARAAACGYFHTVLGPGSDAYHRTHWHFDLEPRGRDGDSKFCK